MLNEKVICAGFGGQGVMSLGQLLTYAGMVEGKEVSWLPSYGPEMRGGTANCSVMISDTPIGSPVITNDATTAIVMNLPSLGKFEKDIVSGGNIFINSSLIPEKTTRTDVKAFYIAANELALELGNARAANMIMLGAYLEVTKAVSYDSIEQTVKKLFAGKPQVIPGNMDAVKKGMEAAKAQM